MTNLTERTLRILAPSALTRGPAEQLQAFRAILFGLAMAFWAPVFAPIYFWMGSIRGGVMIIVVGVALLIPIAALRYTRSVFLTGHLIAGSVFSVLVTLPTITGGTDSPALWWLPAVGIIALFLCSIRSGVAWALLSCSACLLFCLLEHWGIKFENDIGADNLRLLNWASMSGIILCAFSLTLAFKLGEDVARRDLESARLESDKANRAKSAFLANMSHEIRTPMNAVIGMTELVLDTDLENQQREYLNVVRQASESLLLLLNDILDFSKIEADKLQLDCRPFDLHECLGDTMKALAVSAGRRNLELILDLRPDIPRHVVGDHGRLRQIIVNLVGNAIKFTEQGEVLLTVRCDSQDNRDVCLCFSVSDTGIGIPRDKQSQIFGLFEQADASTTRRFGGTGLGLAICSRLVHMMQGYIGVESEEGRGSTFHFTVKFGLAREADVPRRKSRPVIVHGTRALVVDDNATNRRIMQQILSSWGIRPHVVPDARQALGLMHHAHSIGEPYQVVLTDNHMPDMDGFMFIEQVREHPDFDSTIVMMQTSGDEPANLARCRQLRIASYLLKPVKQSELLDELLRTLGVTETEDDSIEKRAVEEAETQKSLNVLLVEDSRVNQKLAEAVLQKAGHQITVVNNGREAVERWEGEDFDVVLMDIQMPEMDGFEATRAIRTKESVNGKRVPIVAMTAHALNGDRERCLEAGMDEYVSKPLRAKHLLETMDKVWRNGHG